MSISVVEQIGQEITQASEAAEELLMDCVRCDRQLTYEEQSFLSARLGWNTQRINNELWRVRRVVHQLAIAGKAADRQALVREHAQAIVDLKSKGDQIQAKIQTLQDELRALEENERRLSKRQQDVDAAVQALRQLVPEHAKSAATAELRMLKATDGKAIAELKTELDHIRHLVTEPPEGDKRRLWLDAVERYGRRFVTRDGHGVPQLTPEWGPHARELAAELPEREATLALLQSAYDARAAELSQGLDYHLNRQEVGQ